MNCQKTREAISSGIGRAVLAAHLDGCAGCERHFQEIHSLLALLKEQPRVAAPSDFEFRVRAGIARAKAAQSESSGFSLSSGFQKLRDDLLSGSLSWFQATAAAAAVAVVATFTVYQYSQTDQLGQPTDSAAGLVAAVRVDATAGSVNVVGAGDGAGGSAVTPSSSAIDAIPTSPTAVSRLSGPSSNRNERAASVSELAASADLSAAVSAIEPSSSDPTVSAANSSMKIFNSEQGRMISASAQMTLIGAEMASPANGRALRGGGYVPSI